MRQSTVIFASLIFAFVIYITVRGQLDDYIDLFKPNGSAPSSKSNDALAGAASKTSDAISNVLNKTKDMLGLGGIF